MLKLRLFSVWFVAPAGLAAAEARLIVLPDGALAGAGRTRSTAAAGDPDLFIRSASK